MGQYDSRIFAAGGLGSISGVVATKPAGADMGEERWDNGIKYRLCCNASLGTPAYPGHVLSAIPSASVGAGNSMYSMTMTTVSGSLNGDACAVVHNATVPTGYYFWGATFGRLASGLICGQASASTGNAVGVDAAGYCGLISTMSLSDRPIAINLSSMITGLTSPTRTGDVQLVIENY